MVSCIRENYIPDRTPPLISNIAISYLNTIINTGQNLNMDITYDASDLRSQINSIDMVVQLKKPSTITYVDVYNNSINNIDKQNYNYDSDIVVNGFHFDEPGDNLVRLQITIDDEHKNEYTKTSNESIIVVTE